MDLTGLGQCSFQKLIGIPQLLVSRIKPDIFNNHVLFRTHDRTVTEGPAEPADRLCAKIPALGLPPDRGLHRQALPRYGLPQDKPRDPSHPNQIFLAHSRFPSTQPEQNWETSYPARTALESAPIFIKSSIEFFLNRRPFDRYYWNTIPTSLTANIRCGSLMNRGEFFVQTPR